MHGVSRPIQISYTVEKIGDRIILEGHTQLNHEQWGLKPVRLLFFSVNPVLKPSFHLEGQFEDEN